MDSNDRIQQTESAQLMSHHTLQYTTIYGTPLEETRNFHDVLYH